MIVYVCVVGKFNMVMMNHNNSCIDNSAAIGLELNEPLLASPENDMPQSDGGRTAAAAGAADRQSVDKNK